MKIFLRCWPLLLLAACNPNAVFQEEKTIPGNQWTYRDSLDFKFQIADTASVYSLALDFEYGLDFPMQNVYVKLFTRFPDGRRPGKAISIDFFDAQGKANGKTSGEKKTGELRAVLQENAFFNQPGEYVLTVHQFSRRDSLPGISKVGFLIEKTGVK